MMACIEILNNTAGSSVSTAVDQLAVNSVYREIMGVSNGVTQALASITRAAGPTLGGVIFGWSLQNELNGGTLSDTPLGDRNLIFYILVVVSLFAIIMSYRIPQKFNVPQQPKTKRSWVEEEKREAEEAMMSLLNESQHASERFGRLNIFLGRLGEPSRKR
eukprot:TRINITY_DN12870_c0_g1_i1.p1 TRINITY_DN12870_c0_g1~~TRINITY_DN12870_c0_g1_i1.p1  ORF type:complete len:161 (+),score=19.16 TRINITY_DN12870_c0_g1_i1:931-1413(+)